MSQVRIVTDSTADIPESVRKELGIEMVPLKVLFGSESYLDGVDIGTEAFFTKLAVSAGLPTTSQPSPVEFMETYKRVFDSGAQSIVSIHLASALSGTYQSAHLAQSMLDGDADVTVVDSLSASYGIGMLVVAAAEAAKQGKSKEEIVQLIEELKSSRRLYFLVDTLEYLQKGGRIGKASALVGSLLNIKPILSINGEGQVYSVDKVRGQKKAMARMIELFQQDYAGVPMHLTVAHGKAPEAAEELNALMHQHFDVRSSRFTEIGPVIGTHTGPGVVAAFVWKA
ncbi:DegV family protein [Paenibacillus silviterrae]|uniref:DegV family protein n=1 Tax=Paenibacillus silviterrae TaxID=3242194 RepID=UPI002543944D|nr:DegV family protein [Paenibacillus chinjuensis]